jgi:hypothetical protein
MPWLFDNISYPVECTYTQSRGVQADAVMMKFLPQGGAIPAVGTLTLSWSATTVTLPNCIVDHDTLNYHPDGIHHVVLAWDRRKRWEYAPPISGFYNVRQTGAWVVAQQKNLRELVTLLLDQMGETSADVSAVPNTIYPAVRWMCEKPAVILEELMQEFGLDLVLGFGSEDVTIVQLGSGSALPTGFEFVQSQTADPRYRPRWIRACFAPTRVQARFLMEAVGLEEDLETWSLIDDLLYKPAAGWGREDPYDMQTVNATYGEFAWQIATSTVYRAYRIKTFSDDSLTIPDGSGVLTDIKEVLPLLGQLVEAESPRTDSYRPVRLFGSHYREVKEQGQPDTQEVTPISFDLTQYPYHFDAENGMVIFSRPLFSVVDDQFVPAELYMEASFNVYDPTTFAPLAYEKDVSFDLNGDNYLPITIPNIFKTSVISYTSLHVATGSTNNESALDTIAVDEAAVIAAKMPDTFSESKVYCVPVLTVRLDGAISQVRHHMTNGEGRGAVNRTTAGRFVEFDREVYRRTERFAFMQGLRRGAERRWQKAIGRRRGPSDE